MKRGGGKAKGGAFERQVCKDLSMWLSEGKRDDLFWRSAMSGGRASVRFKQGAKNLTQVGDLSAIDAWGGWLIDRFIVECKFYKNLQIESLLLCDTGLLYKFWTELQKLCAAQKKHPLLIAKQNQYPAIVMTSNDGALVSRISACAFPIALLPQLGAYVYLYADILKARSPCPQYSPPTSIKRTTRATNTDGASSGGSRVRLRLVK